VPDFYVHIAVTNECNGTLVVSTQPSLRYVVLEPSGKSGRLNCGRKEASPEIPTGQGSTGSNVLIGGFTVTQVTRTTLSFVGDELRNNLTKASIVYYIYINIYVGYTGPRYVTSVL